MNACRGCGSCDQGRKPCASPDACWINTDREPWIVRVSAVQLAVIAVTLAAVLAVIGVRIFGA